MGSKVEWALWFRFKLGGSTCSKINSEGKEKTTKFRNIIDNLDWLFQQGAFPLRESNSILPGKVKELTFEEFFKKSIH